MSDPKSALMLALSALPDSETAGPDGTGYQYAWDELTCDEQAWVKHTRIACALAETADHERQWVLDNIYTIARREANRDDPRGRWGHVLRLCEKVGCKGRGVLRANGGEA